MFDKLAVLFVLVAAVTLSGVDGLPRKDLHREDRDYMLDREFRMWVYEHHHGHMDMEHWAKVYRTWRRNADFVKEHNAFDFSFKLSLNKFAHMNVSDMVKKEHFVKRKSLKEFDFKKFVVPTMMDWRKMGFIPQVRDHTEYNFTHLFPILDSIDAMWAISHYDREHMHFDWASFDEFKDCCWKEGHLWNITYYDCIVRHGGLAKEVDYKSPEHMCMSHMFPAFMKFTGARYVEPMDERALAVAVARQPVAVAVDARHKSFQFYKEGIYYEPFCSHEEMNHAMLLVGYGFKDDKHYWILKNSWGESWGMDGYMFMAKDMDNHCGIATEAMYPF